MAGSLGGNTRQRCIDGGCESIDYVIDTTLACLEVTISHRIRITFKTDHSSWWALSMYFKRSYILFVRCICFCSLYDVLSAKLLQALNSHGLQNQLIIQILSVDGDKPTQRS